MILMEQSLFRLRNWLFFPFGICLVFLIPALIAYSNMNVIKNEVDDKVVTTNLLVKLISNESTSFRLKVNTEKIDFFTYPIKLLEELTTIKVTELGSYLQSEIPVWNPEKMQSREEFQFSIESTAPLEVLLSERELVTKKVDQLNGFVTSKGEKVFIYHSHSWEEYIPTNSELDSKFTIVDAGKLLGEALEDKGIEATIDKTDISLELKKRGWGTGQSYSISRELVQEVMTSNEHHHYFIDLHRDSLGKEFTSITLNHTPYAKIAFVIGQENMEYEKNLDFAKALHQFLETSYPGVSRGIVGKYGENVDGVYNQDLSPNAIVIEVGGVENNKEEITNSIDVLAMAISQYYWQALEVNGQLNNWNMN
jgi:stage II sporulation protein P